jgi:hypothetical protein
MVGIEMSSLAEGVTSEAGGDQGDDGGWASSLNVGAEINGVGGACAASGGASRITTSVAAIQLCISSSRVKVAAKRRVGVRSIGPVAFITASNDVRQRLEKEAALIAAADDRLNPCLIARQRRWHSVERPRR